MVDYNLIRTALNRQKDRIFFNREIITREILVKILHLLEDKRILIITGLRRVGKSTLLAEIMSFLQSKSKNYCYVNFEDEVFLDFEAKDFEKINELLIEIYGFSEYYFFDEIQNIKNFESFVRRLQDDGKKIFLTGSNSSLLSKEFGTKLTGRYKMFELYPFSFREFLTKKNIDFEAITFKTEEKALLKKEFSDYMNLGGIPEYLENKDSDYIKTIYENILYRDIISRYNIKGQKTLRELVNLLSTNISSLFTYNALKNSLGLSNAITIKEYISYLNNSYMFFEMLKFDYSLKKQIASPRKAYIIDPAFFNILGVTFKNNYGRILENIIFIELKRKGKEIFYFQGENECDFVITNNNRVIEVMQSCYQLTKENRDREIGGISEAMQHFKLKEGLILTYEQEEEIVISDKKIHIKPIWRWLLEAKK